MLFCTHPCCGVHNDHSVLDVNGAHYPVCLNTLPPTDSMFWEVMELLGGGASVEDVTHLGGRWDLRFIAQPHFLFPVCPDVSGQPHSCHATRKPFYTAEKPLQL